MRLILLAAGYVERARQNARYLILVVLQRRFRRDEEALAAGIVGEFFFKARQRGPRLEHHAIERHAARAAFLAEHERCRLADTVDIIQAEELRLARIDEKDSAVVTAGADHDRQRVDDLHEPLG